ncbi:unnamed protein product [Pleuronectes platessa]|uniref:Uncharacterized protein n=1 Tax=Pleuronectes platessa TaxID=8262 RepID=A0A9N7UHV9_PLEPL|nr:unnamed protein product [Pleuronectes platessa]
MHKASASRMLELKTRSQISVSFNCKRWASHFGAACPRSEKGCEPPVELAVSTCDWRSFPESNKKIEQQERATRCAKVKDAESEEAMRMKLRPQLLQPRTQRPVSPLPAAARRLTDIKIHEFPPSAVFTAGLELEGVTGLKEKTSLWSCTPHTGGVTDPGSVETELVFI